MKKNLMIGILLFSIFGVGLPAENPPEAVLKKGDVERFVKTFPLLSQDLMKAGMSWEAKSGTMNVPEAVTASNQVLEVLKKHGWDEHFFAKSAAILQCYTQVKYGQAMGTAQSKLARNLREIDENPDISAEMKAQLKAQMKQAMAMVGQQGQVMKNQINPADLILVRPWIPKLEKMLETSGQKEGK